MHASHRQLVLLLSASLTMLVIGGVATGYLITSEYQARLADEAFLEKQLAAVQGNVGPKGPGRLPSQVRVTEVRLDTISPITPFPGKLFPIRIATISSEVSGLIREIPIEIGSKLKRDETLIAQIDQTWQTLLLEQNDAQIASLDVELNFQMSELDRIQPLAATRAVSASDLNQQTSKVDQIQQDLTRLKVINREIRKRLERTTIKAPFDGYVVERNADLGELVSPGTPIAKIISDGQVDARIDVVEDVINRLKVGDTIPILIDKIKITIEGKIHEIVPYAPNKAMLFPVIVRLDDQEGLLKAGMSATAFISTADPKEGIVVPKDAVLEKPGSTTVWVVTNEQADQSAESNTAEVAAQSFYTAIPVPVTIIADAVEIYSVVPETDEGRRLLVPGAKTIIEGAEVLTPGQQVRITTINSELYKNLPHRSGQLQFSVP